MKIFLDTANIEDIKKYSRYGFIHGITTNPALMAKEGNRNVKDVILEIAEYVDGPINVEVISTNADGMVEEAEKISKMHKNVVVKIPAVRDGFKALGELSKLGIRTNLTLVYTANQALLAAINGAAYASPFIGRLDVNSTSGTQLIKEIATIYKNYDFKTQILAASMRNSIYVKEAALAGAQVATIPPSVIEDMMNCELSKSALDGFLKDWNKTYPGKNMLGEDVQ